MKMVRDHGLGEDDQIGSLSGDDEPLSPSPLRFELPKTDAEIAKDFRDQARAHLELLAELMNEAERTHGMRIGFQIGRDGFGRNTVAALEVVKVL